MGTAAGEHCALGFYLDQIGIPREEIQQVASPGGVIGAAQRVSLERQKARLQQLIDAGAQWLVCPVKGPVPGGPTFNDSEDADAIMEANDSGLQFGKIKAIFAKHGIEVELVP